MIATKSLDVSDKRIVVTGSIAYDDIMDFGGLFQEHFHPDHLHQINISFAVQNLTRHIGGTAINISYAMRQCTHAPIYIVGAFGKDAHEIVALLDAQKIDHRHSHFDTELFTSTGKVITDAKNNQLWGYYYGAATHGDQVNLSTFAKNSFFIISANHPHAFMHVQRFCITHKIPYMYDPGMSLTWISDADLKKGMSHARMIIGNEYEMAQIFTRIRKKSSDFTRNDTCVITTLGEKGVRIENNENSMLVPSLPLKNIMDPTGAGDAWRGAFIASLHEKNTVAYAAAFANCVAGISLSHKGTTGYTLSPKDIKTHITKIISSITHLPK